MTFIQKVKFSNLVLTLCELMFIKIPFKTGLEVLVTQIKCEPCVFVLLFEIESQNTIVIIWCCEPGDRCTRTVSADVFRLYICYLFPNQRQYFSKSVTHDWFVMFLGYIITSENWRNCNYVLLLVLKYIILCGFFFDYNITEIIRIKL